MAVIHLSATSVTFLGLGNNSISPQIPPGCYVLHRIYLSGSRKLYRNRGHKKFQRNNLNLLCIGRHHQFYAFLKWWCKFNFVWVGGSQSVNLFYSNSWGTAPRVHQSLRPVQLFTTNSSTRVTSCKLNMRTAATYPNELHFITRM